MWRNTLDVIQRISISNRPRFGGSPYSDITMCWCWCCWCFFFFFYSSSCTFCPARWHSAASFRSCPHCFSFSPPSPLCLCLSLSFACCSSQLLLITPMPGNPSHVSFFDLYVLPSVLAGYLLDVLVEQHTHTRAHTGLFTYHSQFKSGVFTRCWYSQSSHQFEKSGPRRPMLSQLQNFTPDSFPPS